MGSFVQQTTWGWMIAAYLFLGGLGGAVGAIGIGIDLYLEPHRRMGIFAALSGFVFRPEMCLACDQCLNLCPQQAIERADDASGRGPLLLRRLAVRRCTRCGQETTALVEGLCPACRRQEQQQAIWTGLVQPPGQANAESGS